MVKTGIYTDFKERLKKWLKHRLIPRRCPIPVSTHAAKHNIHHHYTLSRSSPGCAIEAQLVGSAAEVVLVGQCHGGHGIAHQHARLTTLAQCKRNGAINYDAV